MKYVKEPWKNRVLGDGWSHNPYKRKAGLTNDPDVVATEIAEKYIRLLIQAYANDFKLMPVTGAEVNFAVHGVEGSDVINYINRANAEARAKLHGQQPDECARLWEILQSTTICENDYLAYPLENYPITNDYYNIASTLRDPGRPNLECLKSLQAFKDPCALEKIKNESGWQINPAFHTALVQYLLALQISYVTQPNSGAIGRAYIDDFTLTGHVDAPEIATPPRHPLVTIAQVNTLKRLLMESTYRFHAREDISPVAKRMHEALGDYDISFIDPVKYYNLAEQISLSFQEISDDNPDYAAIRRSENFGAYNILDDPAMAALIGEMCARHLPADRLLTIGNRFPFDEAKQRGEPHNHIRKNREDRVGGRMEICDFNDGCSNIALSMLGVLATGYVSLHEIANYAKEDGSGSLQGKIGNIVDRIEILIPMPQLPQKPSEALINFDSGPTRLAMIVAALSDATKKGLSQEEAKKSFALDMVMLSRALEERQTLLLRRPWGGKQRAEVERVNGWKIGNPKRYPTEDTIPVGRRIMLRRDDPDEGRGL